MNAPQKTPPTVSIILPTYNRARFLPQAFEAIRSQRFTNWELIVVDDGSTDDSTSVIHDECNLLSQPSQLIHQENQGAYGARNTGLDYATGKYIAFYDSDDLWLPQHLHDSVDALESHSELDWAYGACRVVDTKTRRVVNKSTFYERGKPRPFMQLAATQHGRLNIIEDPQAISCAICAGFYCGLQNSVIRRSLFEDYRFRAANRNEAEDQLVVIEQLHAGRRFGYLDQVHVEYRIHESNSSAAGNDVELSRQERVLSLMIDGFEWLRTNVDLPPDAMRALRKRLAHDLFWKLGYSTCLQQGKQAEGLQAFRRALRHWPWDWRCWKTYWLTRIRSFICSPSRHNVQDTKTVG